ncbi:MAG TPA: hypothetical protein VGE07_08375 [Herpetosiphonaceae bacterium]
MDDSTPLEQLLRWDGEQTVMSFDQQSGAWLIVAVHSTRLGPGAGGTRMRRYPDLAAGWPTPSGWPPR